LSAHHFLNYALTVVEELEQECDALELATSALDRVPEVPRRLNIITPGDVVSANPASTSGPRRADGGALGKSGGSSADDQQVGCG